MASSLTALACRGSNPRGDTHQVRDAATIIGDATGGDASSDPPERTSTLPAADAGLPDVTTDWCIEAMRGLDDETCYVIPDGGARELLVYLAGIIPPTPTSPQKEKVERVVYRAATKAGVAALFPRGRRGIGPSYARDWWAWPTSTVDYARYAPEMIAHWLDAKTRLERSMGRAFDRTYLAGSSSGAYFVVALALRGALPVDGFAAMSGGSAAGWRADDLSALEHKPFYIGVGASDTSSVSGARSLATLLLTSRWPVRIVEHPLGHGAHEVYLDEAFAFWRSSAPPR